VPLPAALGDGDYAAIYSDLLEPIATQFQPQLVLVSAGFDAHRDDPLADMALTEDGFAHLCGVACRIADNVAGGRLALLLEGGYDLNALAKSVRGCVEVLAGSTPPPGPAPSQRGRAALVEVTAHQRKYWRV
jgi:acetoin utilization deacetylase AcuC-like enzyme